LLHVDVRYIRLPSVYLCTDRLHTCILRPIHTRTLHTPLTHALHTRFCVCVCLHTHRMVVPSPRIGYVYVRFICGYITHTFCTRTHTRVCHTQFTLPPRLPFTFCTLPGWIGWTVWDGFTTHALVDRRFPCRFAFPLDRFTHLYVTCVPTHIFIRLYIHTHHYRYVHTHTVSLHAYHTRHTRAHYIHAVHTHTPHCHVDVQHTVVGLHGCVTLRDLVYTFYAHAHTRLTHTFTHGSVICRLRQFTRFTFARLLHTLLLYTRSPFTDLLVLDSVDLVIDLEEFVGICCTYTFCYICILLVLLLQWLPVLIYLYIQLDDTALRTFTHTHTYVYAFYTFVHLLPWMLHTFHTLPQRWMVGFTFDLPLRLEHTFTHIYVLHTQLLLVLFHLLLMMIPWVQLLDLVTVYTHIHTHTHTFLGRCIGSFVFALYTACLV